MPGHQKTHQTAQPHKSEKSSTPEKHSGQKVDPQQMMEAPETLSPEDVLAAQQVLGNTVVQRALDPGSKREEATDAQGNLLPELSDAINQARGSGASLPKEIQAEAGKRLGGNFKDVRLHTGEQADLISRRIRARAFTIGKDIFFKQGAYAPGSSQGRETLIHELTHVVQQSGSTSSGGKLKLGEPGSAMEQQADRQGKKAAQTVTKSDHAQVQRMMPAEEEELQMQPEDEEILQMQGEEEELQMLDDDDWETDSEAEKPEPKPSPAQMKAMSSQLVKQMAQKPDREPEKEKQKPEEPEQEDQPEPGKALESMNPQNRLKIMLGQKDKARQAKGSALKQIGDKSKSMNLGSTDQMDRLKALEERGQKNLKSNYLSEQKAGTSGFLNASIEKKKSDEQKQEKEAKQAGTKEKWLKTLRDPNASSAEIEQAKKRLQTLHKDSVSDKDLQAAEKERQAALEDAARSGDDKAFEKMESEKAAAEEEKKKNPSRAAKFGNFAKKAGIGLAKGIGGIIAGQASEGLKHFLGADSDKDEDEEDEKEDKKSKKGSKSKGSGNDSGDGSAVGTLMKEYARVVEENKELKAQLQKKG